MSTKDQPGNAGAPAPQDAPRPLRRARQRRRPLAEIHLRLPQAILEAVTGTSGSVRINALSPQHVTKITQLIGGVATDIAGVLAEAEKAK